jgi:hypothetical protein
MFRSYDHLQADCNCVRKAWPTTNFKFINPVGFGPRLPYTIPLIYSRPRLTPRTVDSLHYFKCKSSRNTRHTVIFGIPLWSSFWNTRYNGDAQKWVCREARPAPRELETECRRGVPLQRWGGGGGETLWLQNVPSGATCSDASSWELTTAIARYDLCHRLHAT